MNRLLPAIPYRFMRLPNIDSSIPPVPYLTKCYGRMGRKPISIRRLAGSLCLIRFERGML